MAVDYYVMDYPTQAMIDVGALRWLAEIATDGTVTAEIAESRPDWYGSADVARWIREVAGGRPCRLVDDVGDEGYDAELSGEWTVYTLDPDRDSGPDEWRIPWPPSQPVTPTAAATRRG